MTSLVDYQGFCGFSAEATAAPSDDEDDSEQEQGEKVEEGEEEGFQRISPQEVVERMEGGWAPFVLDVRWAPSSGRGVLDCSEKSLGGVVPIVGFAVVQRRW